jgi:hypothetical protein
VGAFSILNFTGVIKKNNDKELAQTVEDAFINLENFVFTNH